MKRLYRKVLLGMGFDAKDGHIRITKGENFRLFGGSDETHGEMQEKVIKFNEELDKKRKTLDSIGEKEFYDIAKSVGMKIQEDKK